MGNSTTNNKKDVLYEVIVNASSIYAESCDIGIATHDIKKAWNFMSGFENGEAMEYLDVPEAIAEKVADDIQNANADPDKTYEVGDSVWYEPNWGTPNDWAIAELVRVEVED